MSIEMIFRFLAPINIGLLYLLAVIGIIYFKRVSPEFKIIIIYFWTAAIMEIISMFLENNLVLMPVGSLVDLSLLTILYLRYMLVQGSYRYLLAAFSGLSIIPIYFDFKNALGNLHDYIFYGSLYASLIIIIFSITYFVQSALFSHAKVSDKLQSINLMIFILYVFNLLFVLSTNFLITENLELVSYFWLIRLIIIFIINLGFGYLIWKHGRTPSISQSA